MPKYVRNFWLDLFVDGRKHRITTGPRKVDGGFTLRILVRDKGKVSDTEVNIKGVVMAGGTLSVVATDNKDNEQVLVLSQR